MKLLATRKRIVTACLLILAIGLAALLWLAWPVYGFLAHNGDAPLPPWGWMEMPDSIPASQQVLDARYADAGERVLSAMAAHREAIDAPAMTAAVAVHGELVWQGAVGWADIEEQTPANTDTIFRIGSTSKAITATALARLVERGLIDLDAPIAEYLSELPNPDWANITPRMLASHMAGIPHYGDNRDRRGLYQSLALNRYYADVRDALEIFDGSPLLFEPGSDFEYSSLGTVLLGAVMSEAAGQSYRQIIREEVLRPAAMNSTIVARKQPAETDALATFYYRDFEDNREGEAERYRRWRPVDLSHRLPGGGWASTSADLARMGALHLNEDYISAAVREQFWTPQRLSSGAVNEQDYAIGWRWREYELDGIGLARNANHGGVSRGAQSWLLVFPDQTMAIAFNINSRTEQFGEFGAFYEAIVREFILAAEQAEFGTCRSRAWRFSRIYRLDLSPA